MNLDEFVEIDFWDISQGYLINELLKQKKVPYCQVIEGNEASLALQRKLHMKISSRYSYWVFDD